MGSTGIKRRNVRRISAGEGMSTMATSVNSAANTLANAVREAAATVRPTTSSSIDGNGSVPIAIALIEANEGLSDNEFGDAAQCITTNPMIATIYVAMSNRNTRAKYIRKQIDGLRGYDTAP